MIIVSGTITLDPTKAEEARALVEPLVATTLEEAGCAQYGYWIHLSEPGTVRVFEEWESQEALDAHMASAHIAAFMGGVGALGVTGVDIQKYEVSNASKLM